jgi:murein DD-endopeptidase MepM/ murein hydrolase activator NlpD
MRTKFSSRCFRVIHGAVAVQASYRPRNVSFRHIQARREPRDIVGFDVISRRVFPAIAIPLALCVNVISARSQGQRPLQVSYTPASVGPGDVAIVEVSGVGRDAKLTASVLAQDLLFHYEEDRQTWRALVGVDLDTKPGAYQLNIRNDARTAAPQTLRVAPKQFRVRRLRVPAEFVEPPPDALAQIGRDTAALAAAYARVSPKKWNGSFVLPVEGKPTSNFGTRSYYNGEPRAPHAGVDFMGAPGTPVRAANHGEVVIASPMYFTGNTVVVDYGERLVSVFAHLSELRTKAGDTVGPDTIVGLVGSTGRVTGPHLHWSVRLNGKRVDPLSLVAATAGAGP